MTSGELCKLTVSELSEKIRTHAVSPVEVTKAVLARIEELNPRVNAFVTVCPELALKGATAAEKEIRAGHYRSPLHGIPVGVKDLFDTAGIRTTYGSGMFRDHVPSRDAAVVERLKAAGAIIVGKTNAHELGVGLTTNNYFYGPTRNPWNLAHVPGGSSGGSAAAIAADLCPATIGSDGGGSIRFPCVFCGVTGIKPTLGRVSDRGEFSSVGSSFAVPGPICKTVRDTALVLRIIAGADPEDTWALPFPVPDYCATLTDDLRGLRVGTSPDFFSAEVDPDVRAAYDATLTRMESLGASIKEIPMPHHGLIVPTLFTIMGGEGTVFITQLVGNRTPELSPEVMHLFEEGPRVTLELYVAALHNRERIRRDYLEAFQKADVIVLPSAPIPAPRIGEEQVTLNGTTYNLPDLCCAYTGAANLTGLPALPIPTGLSRNGLPVGMQIMAPHLEEGRALRVAHALLEAWPEVSLLRSPLAA